MGRKKIEFKYIASKRTRRVTLKKRRVGLVKKAMQLSLLTGAKVHLRVYSEHDNLLIEYYSNNASDFNGIRPNSPKGIQYALMNNQHFDWISKIDSKINEINDLDFQKAFIQEWNKQKGESLDE